MSLLLVATIFLPLAGALLLVALLLRRRSRGGPASALVDVAGHAGPGGRAA